VARAYQERVDIGFDGYNEDPRELGEISEVREYVNKLDEKFPFWLFFLSKHFLGLQCIIYCFLPPFLTDSGRAQIHPERLKDLMLRRWLPAMNHVAAYAGLGEVELRRLTDSAIQYARTGPLNVPETGT
jgi:hypothetical protein